MKTNRSAQGPRDTPNLYRAEVLDNEDPDHYFRVKLKIHGVTGDDISKEEAVWAEVMQGTTPGIDKMIGVSSVLQVGTMVWCMLENGDPNKPVVVGVLSGKDDCSDSLAGEKYINAQSLYTKSGHKVVIDDSEGDEFIYIFHRTGTYIRIDHNGDIWVNGVRDCQFDIARDVTWNIGRHLTVNVEGDETVNIKGTSTWTVDGDRTTTFNANETRTTEGNRTTKVSGEDSVTVDGNRTTTFNADETHSTQGNRTTTVNGEDSVTVNGNKTANYNSNENVTVGGNKTANYGGSENVTVGSSKTENISSSLNITTQNVNITAPQTSISGNLSIGGNISCGGGRSRSGGIGTFAGTVIATNDCIGGGISLKSHTHGVINHTETTPPK